MGGPSELVHRVIESGEITPQAAQRMVGHLALEAHDRDPRPRRIRYGHRAECRDHGLVLADGVLDEVEVDLGEVLERALDSEAWGAEG